MGLLERAFCFGSVAFACGILPASALARDTSSFTPTGEWIAERQGNSCSVSRSFERDGKALSLSLSFHDFSGNFQIRASSKALKGWRYRLQSFRFLPHSTQYDSGGATHSRSKERVITLGWGGVLRPLPEGSAFFDQAYSEKELSAWAEQVEAIELQRRFSSTLVIDTGSLEAVRTLVRPCLLELTEELGLNASKHAEMSRAATPESFNDWARDVWGHFPLSDTLKGTSGELYLAVIISPEGKATRCVSLLDRTTTELAAVSCDRMKQRGFFHPARDENGNAISSFKTFRIVFDPEF